MYENRTPFLAETVLPTSLAGLCSEAVDVSPRSGRILPGGVSREC